MPNFSWAELEGPTQINKSTAPVDSDVDLNSPNLIQFEPKPKLLVKYVIIIYELGSEHEKFGVWMNEWMNEYLYLSVRLK